MLAFQSDVPKRTGSFIQIQASVHYNKRYRANCAGSSNSVRTHIPVSQWSQLVAVYSDLSLEYPLSPRAPRREAWCGLQRDLQPAATRHRLICPIFLRCATTTIAAATARTSSSSFGWEKKNYKNTWRCPDCSADYPAGYWLRAPVCHHRPKQSRTPSALGLL